MVEEEFLMNYRAPVPYAVSEHAKTSGKNEKESDGDWRKSGRQHPRQPESELTNQLS